MHSRSLHYRYSGQLWQYFNISSFHLTIFPICIITHIYVLHRRLIHGPQLLIFQQWPAACRLAHVPPSTLTYSQKSTGRWGIAWQLHPVSPPLLLCLLSPSSRPPVWWSCAVRRCLCSCTAGWSCSYTGVGGLDVTHRECCELWGEPGLQVCLHASPWTFLGPELSWHRLWGCPGVHKDTLEGQSCQTWPRHPFLSLLPAAWGWEGSPLLGWG